MKTFCETAYLCMYFFKGFFCVSLRRLFRLLEREVNIENRMMSDDLLMAVSCYRYCVQFTPSLLTVKRVDGDSGLSHGRRFPRSGVATVEEAEQISAQAGRRFQCLRHIHHRAPQFDSQACVQALR